jgi:DNA-binding transcriptional LysR family regulator
MDRFDAMRLFVRIVERKSFTLAAQDAGVPRSTVTQAIMHMEERLGARVLQRTTRTVKPTLDGEAYYQRCLAILADVEDADSAFKNAGPKGLLRVEIQGTIARHFLLPRLPAFLARHPDIEIAMSETDRWIDIVEEGVDCVLRYGTLPDSELLVRKVALLDRVTCAAPEYLHRFGVPENPDSLAGHRMVGRRSGSTGALVPLEFTIDGSIRNLILPSPLSVTGAESFLAAIRLGFGLAQAMRFSLQSDLESGKLVEILPDWPPSPIPISFLHPRSRHLPPRLRVFQDWVVREFTREKD